MPTQIPQGTGTAIGTMTAQGGLAAAFDGVTSQIATSSAVSSGVSGYVGKAYSSGKVISKAVVYGSNDNGFIFTVNPSVTIQLRGKNGAPSSPTDGTLLGSITFTDTSNESAGRAIASGDVVNSYTNVWVYVNDGAADSHIVSELQIFEVSNTPQSVAISCASSIGLSIARAFRAAVSITCSCSAAVSAARRFVASVAIACTTSTATTKAIGKKVAIACTSATSSTKMMFSSLSIQCSSSVSTIRTYVARVVIAKVRTFLTSHFAKATLKAGD